METKKESLDPFRFTIEQVVNDGFDIIEGMPVEISDVKPFYDEIEETPKREAAKLH